MKTGHMKTGKIIALITAIAFAWSLGGCGGGGGGGGTVAPTIKAGHGRLAAQLHFNSRAADRAAGQITGSVNIAVSITGYYEEDDSVFPPVTASIQLASGGQGTVSLPDVPIGVNHILTAVATWSDGAKETIKAIIPSVREGETTSAYADPHSTIVANAAIALAERQKKILSKISTEDIAKITSVVNAFLGAGYGYNDIDIQDVLDYDENADIVASVIVEPASATLMIGGTVEFTAIQKNTYGIAVSTPAAVTWTVSGNVGTIDSAGLFTASAEGEGTVTATSGSISGSAAVTVSLTATCGNGTVETGETCDDGTNNGEPNYCNSTCDGNTAAVCGNATVETGETCDDGNTATETCVYGQTSCTVCDSSCAFAAGEVSYCGDSFVDTAGGESCDDGNTTVGDGCSASCAEETPPYLVGKYVRGDFCAPPGTTSGAQFFTSKRAMESDGYGTAVFTLLEHSQGFATGPRTIPFTHTAGSYSDNQTAGRYSAFSVDGNVMLRSKSGVAIETGEQVSAMCLSVAIRANPETAAPLSVSSLNGTYIVFSMGTSSAGSPWTTREQVVFNGAGGYTSTFLSASFTPAGSTTGTYTVDAGGSMAILDSGGAVEAGGMITPDGNMLYLIKTNPTVINDEIYLSVGMKVGTGFTGPLSNDRYGLYMLGVESADGLWLDMEYGTLDVDTSQNSVYNTLVNTNNSIAGSFNTITYNTTGEFTTNEGDYGMVTPDGSLLMLVDTDLTADFYVTIALGAYREPAPTAACGNGSLELGEACDIGGESATCNSDCTTPSCGDGVTNATAGEACDDGNTVTETCAYGDTTCTGCDSTCASSIAAAYCGDNLVNGTSGGTLARVPGRSASVVIAPGYENCDDGGSNTDTPCSAAYGASCTYCSTSCISQYVTGGYCGDGTINGSEVCDDGSTTNADGCSADCLSDETCGNSILDSAVGENCDDGNTVDGDGCSANCVSTEICGNSLVDSAVGETCDDGNTVDGDGCSSICVSEPL